MGRGKSRGVIKFQQKASRPPISREECDYWLDMLSKVLKIGTEFEFNLPSGDRVLEVADRNPCMHASRKPCVTDCANLETCLVERHPTFCLTRSTGRFLGKTFACPAKNDADVSACASCPAWALNCRGLNCASHTPFCTVCPAFQRKGENNVENGNIHQDAESIRQEMRELFQPSGFVGKVGQSGVLDVVKDNSLVNNGGIEVPTVGRRVHWNSFYNMCNGIIDPIVKKGGFMNERSGQHFHVLAGYFGGGGKLSGPGNSISELETPLPEIVLANFHQLNRRYELAMFWIMSAGQAPDCLTRWSKFRVPIFGFSAMSSRMSRVQKELSQNIPSPRNDGKYASVALHFCKFNREGNLTTFHIENRIADGAASPAVVTAWAMMIYAMILKAVRFSYYGLMEVGNQEYRKQVQEIMPHLINGQERGYDGNRFADNSNLGPYIPWLQSNARELIQMLKPELGSMGPAFDILMELAEQPVSLRRIRGDSWEKIEEDLYQRQESGRDGLDLIESELQEVIDLAGVVDCDNLEMWVEEVAAHTGQPSLLVAEVIRNMVEHGHYRWSPAVGAIITS